MSIDEDKNVKSDNDSNKSASVGAEIIIGIVIVIGLAYFRYGNDSPANNISESIFESSPLILIILCLILAGYLMFKGIGDLKKGKVLKGQWRIAMSLTVVLIAVIMLFV